MKTIKLRKTGENTYRPEMPLTSPNGSAFKAASEEIVRRFNWSALFNPVNAIYAAAAVSVIAFGAITIDQIKQVSEPFTHDEQYTPVRDPNSRVRGTNVTQAESDKLGAIAKASVVEDLRGSLDEAFAKAQQYEKTVVAPDEIANLLSKKPVSQTKPQLRAPKAYTFY